MTIQDLLKNRDRNDSFLYSLLDRIRINCSYYLSFVHRDKSLLWAGDEHKQIEYMKAIYNYLEEKPEWLTMEDILNYEKEMCK